MAFVGFNCYECGEHTLEGRQVRINLLMQKGLGEENISKVGVFCSYECLLQWLTKERLDLQVYSKEHSDA